MPLGIDHSLFSIVTHLVQDGPRFRFRMNFDSNGGYRTEEFLNHRISNTCFMRKIGHCVESIGVFGVTSRLFRLNIGKNIDCCIKEFISRMFRIARFEINSASAGWRVEHRSIDQFALPGQEQWRIVFKFDRIIFLWLQCPEKVLTSVTTDQTMLVVMFQCGNDRWSTRIFMGFEQFNVFTEILVFQFLNFSFQRGKNADVLEQRRTKTEPV